MKGTPCSRGNYAPLKTSSITCISVLRSGGSAPGGVWGSAPTLLASSVNGSGAGYAPHTTPIPRSGFVLGRRADVSVVNYLRPAGPRSAAPNPTSGSRSPENVGSRFLSLPQSAPLQTFSAIFGTAKKPNCRRYSRNWLGGWMPEDAELLSEWPFVSEAWGLADLLYKLFWMPFQWLSFVSKPEGRHPVRLVAPTISANEPADLTPSPQRHGAWRWQSWHLHAAF